MEAKKSVDIVRRMRHDFANHLQVISGYMELGRYQSAKDYIVEIVKEMTAEKEIFEAGFPPRETLYLYNKALTAYNMGIILKYGELEIDSRVLDRLDQKIDEALNDISRQLGEREEEVVVGLSIHSEEKGIALLFSCASLSRDPMKISIRE